MAYLLPLRPREPPEPPAVVRRRRVCGSRRRRVYRRSGAGSGRRPPRHRRVPPPPPGRCAALAAVKTYSQTPRLQKKIIEIFYLEFLQTNLVIVTATQGRILPRKVIISHISEPFLHLFPISPSLSIFLQSFFLILGLWGQPFRPPPATK